MRNERIRTYNFPQGRVTDHRIGLTLYKLDAVMNGDLDELNHHFGLDYWSNRIDSWEDFPDVTATINESLGGEFDKFRRDQVRAFLQWQADIVREYAHDDQFITHNFDFEWRGYSYGVQPAVRAGTALHARP